MSRCDRATAASRDVAADERFLVPTAVRPVFAPSPPATQEPAILAGLDRLAHDLGIGEQEIRRREHVEHLARRELHHLFMLFADAAQPGGRIVPPLLVSRNACDITLYGHFFQSSPSKR